VGWDQQYSNPPAVKDCQCPENLKDFEYKGWMGTFAIFSVSGGSEGATNLGLGKSSGAGFAKVECKVRVR